MGQPFKASFVERFVGHCDSCGLSSRGAGVRSGRAAVVCWGCAEQIARVVSKRTTALPAGAPVEVSADHEGKGRLVVLSDEAIELQGEVPAAFLGQQFGGVGRVAEPVVGQVPQFLFDGLEPLDDRFVARHGLTVRTGGREITPPASVAERS